jgi:hypothetical protein
MVDARLNWGLALLLTWVIVGLQAAKAAVVNPTRSLRNE